jgi:hypothetical protein
VVHFADTIKFTQCNKYKAELIDLRTRLGQPVDDLSGEEV